MLTSNRNKEQWVAHSFMAITFQWSYGFVRLSASDIKAGHSMAGKLVAICHIGSIRYTFNHWFHAIQVNTSLTHWCRVTYICVSKLNIVGSDNGLFGRRQAVNWTKDEMLLPKQTVVKFKAKFIHLNAFEYVVCEMVAICLGRLCC